jgi:dipeptidase E
MRLLLGSGGLSTPERREAWKKEADSFLGPVRRVVFLPYAGGDYQAYIARVRELDLAAGREVVNLPECSDPASELRRAEAIFVGGGNSFRLLRALYDLGLRSILQDKARSGTPYLGISAGTNMACPTMKTTNDMPITYPPSLDALGLVPFQINPHYFAGAIHYETPEGLTRYGGETRDDRLREFHEMNDTPVVGLWEGSIVRIERGEAALCGTAGCRIFRKGKPAEDRSSGASLTDLLRGEG